MDRRVKRGELSDVEASKSIINFTYAVVTRYSEGAAAAACQMYDSVAIMAGKHLPESIPANVPSYREVAKAINGARRFSNNPKTSGYATGRLVKRTGIDTTINNALRDGAEWAWIPNGDTCVYCKMLAMQGWRKASKKYLVDGHEKHIHSNCDCTYAIRFDGFSNVEGYDPQTLLEEYNAAKGKTAKEKMNYLRRKQYAASRDQSDAYKEYFGSAKPGEGRVSFHEHYLSQEEHKKDLETANWMKDIFGGDYSLIQESRTHKTPDCQWINRGTWIEFKNPSTPSAVEDRIRKGVSQLVAVGETEKGVIVIDITNRKAEQSLMLEAIKKEGRARSRQKVLDLIVREGNSVVDIIRIKK